MFFRKGIVKYKLVFYFMLLEVIISSVPTNAFSQPSCSRAFDVGRFQDQSKVILDKLPLLDFSSKYFNLKENLEVIQSYVSVRQEISEHISNLSTSDSIRSYLDFLSELLSTKNGLRLVDLNLFHSKSNEIKKMQSDGSLGDISILSLNLVKPIVDRHLEISPKELKKYLKYFRSMISRKEVKNSKETNREARLKIIPAILVALDSNEIRNIYKYIVEANVSESALADGSSALTNPSFVYALDSLSAVNRNWLLTQLSYFQPRLKRTNETDPKRVGEFLWGVLNRKKLSELSTLIPASIEANKLVRIMDNFPAQILREGSTRGNYGFAKVLEVSRLIRLNLLDLFEGDSFIQIYGSLPNRKARYVLDSYDTKSLVKLSDIDLVPSAELSKRLKTFFKFDEAKIEIELPYRYSFGEFEPASQTGKVHQLFENANQQVISVLNSKMNPDINVLSLKATLEYITKEELYLADSNSIRIQIDKSGVYLIITHPRKATFSKHKVVF